MNQRLYELMKQAGYAAPELAGRAQVLADLLVRECATLILNNDIEKLEDWGDNHPYFSGWERGCIDSAVVIKDHFGVE